MPHALVRTTVELYPLGRAPILAGNLWDLWKSTYDGANKAIIPREDFVRIPGKQLWVEAEAVRGFKLRMDHFYGGTEKAFGLDATNTTDASAKLAEHIVTHIR